MSGTEDGTDNNRYSATRRQTDMTREGTELALLHAQALGLPEWVVRAIDEGLRSARGQKPGKPQSWSDRRALTVATRAKQIQEGSGHVVTR